MENLKKENLEEDKFAEKVYQELGSTKIDITARLLLQLLKGSLGLRVWLDSVWHDPDCKKRFDQYLNGKVSLPYDIKGEDLLRWIYDEGNARNRANAELVASATGKFNPRPYGGKSWSEIIYLIRKRQSGRINPAAVLLAIEWRHWKAQAKEGEFPDIKLLLASSIYLQEAFAEGKYDYLHQLKRAGALFEKCLPGKKDLSKVSAQDACVYRMLFYILKNPKQEYSIQEMLLEEERAGALTRDIAGELSFDKDTSEKFINRYLTRNGFRMARDSQVK